MPPKKRKAASAKGTKTTDPDTSSVVLSPAGRPKRTSVSEPRYDFINHHRPSTTGKRGRPSGASSIARAAIHKSPAAATQNVVGRKRKRAVSVSSANGADADTPTATPAKRGRGRPRKVEAEPEPVAKKGIEAAAAPKKRGRPRKVTFESEPVTEKATDEPPKKRGRPRKVTAEAEPVTKKAPDAASVRKRGRPRKLKVEAEPVTEDDHANLDIEVDVPEQDGGVETKDSDIQYWLMKAEPNSRMEKGHDVKFSIDDLMAKTEPEAWDGVRNAAARNNLRAMRKGDLAFFYHSNCDVPGIAGVMRIVQEHSVDESAFDPNHPYYDPKSDRAKPKWDVVHVEFVRKFDQLITLRQLKSFSEPSGALKDMQMLRQSRLSVSSVKPAEWEFILQLAGEPLSLGQEAGKDGYESDVDGEGEETVADVDVDLDTDVAKEVSGSDDGEVEDHEDGAEDVELDQVGAAKVNGTALDGADEADEADKADEAEHLQQSVPVSQDAS
ncbi:Thymocyte nuclear protein 1 [Exophiala dermatitidis]